MSKPRLRRAGRAVAAFALVSAPFAILGPPATASHGSNTIDVGIANDGSSRNNYDDSDISVLAGTPITFFFDNGFHNVVWTSANPGGLPNSPGAPGGDGVGTSFSVTPNVAGTYIYFCSIHTNAATALAATDFSAARPSEMYGRIVVTADGTAPTWVNADPVVATADSASQITVTWPAATDNSGTALFDVYQNTANDQPSAALVSNNQSSQSYVASGLTAGQTYWFWVIPVDGAGNAGPARTASATTSSVAASATASAVVQFAVDPTLSITVSPSVLDLGTLSPAAAGTGTATVTIGSNDTWSLNLKSIGRDSVDDVLGDDAVFTDDTGTTIPVDRATWNAGAGATPLSDAGAVAVTGQPAAGSADVVFTYSVQPLFTDPAGVNYRTTVLYTVTQP